MDDFMEFVRIIVGTFLAAFLATFLLIIGLWGAVWLLRALSF